MKEERKGLLDKLLGGKENADTVLKAAEGAQDKLDGAGVARKEADAAALLAQNIAAALAGEGVTLPENAVETILAQVNAAVAPAAAPASGEAMPHTPPAEEEEKQKAAAQAKSLPENGTAPAKVDVAAMAALVATAEPAAPPTAVETLLKQQSDYIASTTKDMGEMAGAMVTMAEVVKAVPALADAIKGLETRLDEIEKQYKDRPRIASRDEQTVVVNEDVLKKLKDAADPTKTVLGIPVKE